MARYFGLGTTALTPVPFYMATGIIQKYMDGTDSRWKADGIDIDDPNKGYTGHIYYRKIGKLVEVIGQVKSKVNITSTSGYNLAQLPSDYYPSSTGGASGASRPTCAIGNPSLGVSIGFVTVDGYIQFFKPPNVTTWDTDTNIYFSFVYLAN